MTTWRYAILAPVFGRGPAVFYVEGHAVEWPSASMSQQLARAGANGWELTTSYSVDLGGNVQFVFKQPARRREARFGTRGAGQERAQR